MTIYDFAMYYGLGALTWAFILGAVHVDLTWSRLFGVLIWPVTFTHWVGQTITSFLSRFLP